MAQLKEYIVTAKTFDDLESLYTDIETTGPGQHGCMPSRAVECYLRRPVSRNTHYWLSDEEAMALAADPRVLAVELTPEALGLVASSGWTQTSSQWSKSASLSQGDLNWGLYRIYNGAQVSNWGYDGTQNVSGTVSIPLSGENVDVVIVDGKLDPDHPEFAINSDGTGGSRVVQYNWYELNPTVTGGSTDTYSYTPYISSSNTSNDGRHAAHVAGITAGNTQGWARKSNIYNISPAYVSGGVSYSFLYDYIKIWHQNKSVNVSTGIKNPTICNNSWQVATKMLYTDISSVTYRGTTTTKSFTKSELNAYGIYIDSSNYAVIPSRTTALDADIADLISAGVIFVACAGNYYTKMDVLGGTDYNNTLTYSGGTIYTNRGSSPGAADNVICVGATGSGVTSGGDRKASFSNAGPRVDIWAPGTYIDSSWIGSTPPTGLATPVLDSRNSSYYTAKDSGTSMASPQVAGILACLLERFPNLTQTISRQWITSTLAATGQIPATTGGPTDYFDLQGAPNYHLKWVDITATYALTPIPSSVDEGSSLIFYISGSNIVDGTYYWTVTNSGDFVTSSGSFTITDNSGSFTVTPTADSITEGAETFTASIRLGSTSGRILQTSDPVTINDTSTLRPTSGFVFPTVKYGSRPASGQVWPRPRIYIA